MNAFKLTTALFNQIFNSQVSFLVFKGLSTYEAEDLAQEIILKAERTFDESKNVKFTTHVRNVSKTMLIDFFRNKRIEFNNSLASISYVDTEGNEVLQIEDTCPTILDVLESDDKYSKLHEAISKLNDKQQLVITEHYINELKVTEIVDKHGLGLSDVKLSLKRGREKLFNELS